MQSGPLNFDEIHRLEVLCIRVRYRYCGDTGVPMSNRDLGREKLRELVLNDLRSKDDDARAAFDKEFGSALPPGTRSLPGPSFDKCLKA